MSAPDPFLLELFREEMAAHSAVLTEGLLSLERQGGTRERIEPLMRAAHSIKGAARVVDLEPIVRVAHAMEDVLVAAGAGKATLDAGAIDVLLGALDWMNGLGAVADGELGGWLQDHGEEAADWVARIGANGGPALAAVALSAAEPAADAGSLPPATSPGAPDAVAEGLPAPANPPTPPAAGEPESLAVPQSPPVPPPPMKMPETPVGKAAEARPAGETAEPAEAPIRITAETLTQMLAHAADMLLESRRIETLSRDYQSLKRMQRRLMAMVPAQADRHELRTGLAELGAAIDRHDQHMGEVATRATFLAERLHNLALRGRMRPFSDGVQGFPRMIRDLARQLGKPVEFEILGQGTLVDRDILSRLEAPLNHLLRNAVDHGLEAPEARLAAGKTPVGHLRLEARHRSGRLLVSLADDGRGIDIDALRAKIAAKGLIAADMAARLSPSELFDFLFLPGFSTRDEVTEISGRGVGLDVVQTMVHACGGSLQVSSEPGWGTRFELHLPVTRSVIRTLRVDVGGQAFAIPLARIDRAERRQSRSIESLNGNDYFVTDRGNIALISARRLLGLEEAPLLPEYQSLVLIGFEDRQYALEVDALRGECDMVVRPLDPRLGKVPNLSAVALDEQGQPVLILDADDLVRSADRLAGQLRAPRRRPAAAVKRRTRRILVVDDSITVREVERKLLENAGYDVEVAVDGVDGWNQLGQQPYDLVVSDVDMPRMNGIELVTRIKTDPRLKVLPVVIVSYKDREEDRRRGMQAGADYYLTKSSFHDASLIQAVRDLIGGAQDV